LEVPNENEAPDTDMKVGRSDMKVKLRKEHTPDMKVESVCDRKSHTEKKKMRH
jgi:hypothetical protein